MSDCVPEPDGERLAWMYRQMLRIREFEERVKATFTEHPGVIRRLVLTF
jgi:TPP-dependent pyruvate/acetoin dehydrogenase alpha subunit